MKQFCAKLLLLALWPASSLSAQPPFSDGSTAAGIGHPGRNYGVAFGDFDGDGGEDIYISRHNAPNLLYRAVGQGRFEEVAQAAGVAHAGTTTVSTFADIDNDGDLDLYLGNRDEDNILYRNNGDGTFTDISAVAGVNSGFRTRAVLFGDVDRDGWVDLYVANMNAPNFLYHNNADGTFTNIIEQANAQDYGVAMGSLFFDYDNDGDLDLYLTHDANQPNILYRNDGSGHFENTSAYSGANIAAQGMGVDFADVNNDGYFDLYITNLYSNELLLNDGDGTFSLATAQAGVGDLGMGWGTVFLDYDNDGWTDLYAVNDYYFAPFYNVLYRNTGGGTFEAVGAGSPVESPLAGYGVAAGDVNADGFPDLVLANAGSNDGNQLLLNMAQGNNHFVKVQLEGTLSNRSAIGARVVVEAGGHRQMDEVCAGSGYASQNSFALHFGLGAAAVIDRLEIFWPSGEVEAYEGLAADQSYRFTETSGFVTAAPEEDTARLEGAVFPNPVSGTLQLRCRSHQAGRGQLSLLDIRGQVVWEKEVGVQAGWNSWPIDMRALSPGLYYLQGSGALAGQAFPVVRQ